MPEPEDEAFTLIQSRPEGVLQSELWKELGVDRPEMFEDRKETRRERAHQPGGIQKRRDQDLPPPGQTNRPVHPEDLLAGDELIPCIACDLECIVDECHPLMDWMYQLAIVGNSNR